MTTWSCAVTGKPTKDTMEQKSQALVQGRWTHHAYKMSHDGKTTVIHKVDGFQILQGEKTYEYKVDLTAHNPREFIFSPDNRFVAFWAPLEKNKLSKRIAVMALGGLSSKLKYKIVYDPPSMNKPFGMEWSPAGDALFVIERARIDKLEYTLIRRINMPSGGTPKELVRRLGVIDFFMPPVSRFENGGGPSKKPYKIIFGAPDGLYLVGPNGKGEERLSKIPAMGLHNLEWNPKPEINQVLLFFRAPVAGPDGRKFQGVYQVNLDNRKSAAVKEDEFMENLYDETDIHTLWFSPKGTYTTWAGKSAVFFRKADAPPGTEPTKIEILDEDEQPADIRGATWNDKETLLAFTAGSDVMVYSLKAAEKAKKNPKAKKKVKYLFKIASFKKGFGAEPRFVGDRVFVTQIEDWTAEMKELRNKPVLDLPDARKLGSGSGRRGR